MLLHFTLVLFQQLKREGGGGGTPRAGSVRQVLWASVMGKCYGQVAWASGMGKWYGQLMGK